MSIVITSRPGTILNPFHSAVGNKSVYVFSASGSEITNDGYRLQINVYQNNQSTLLAGPFDYYNDGSNNITVNLDQILAQLIDIISANQSIYYSIQYQEIWDGGNNSAVFVTVPNSYVALYGYSSNSYVDFIDSKLLNKITKVWEGLPYEISYLTAPGTGLQNGIARAKFGNVISSQIIFSLDAPDDTILNKDSLDPIPDLVLVEFVDQNFSNELDSWSQVAIDDNSWVTTGAQQVQVTIDENERSHILYQELPIKSGETISFTVDVTSGIPTPTALIQVVGSNSLSSDVADWDSIDSRTFTGSSYSDLAVATESYRYVGLLIFSIPAPNRVYKINEFSVSANADGNEATGIQLIFSDSIPNEIFSVSLDYITDHCNGVMLKWINSLGGIDQYLFSHLYYESFEFDSVGNKYLTQTLYAELIPKPEWLSLQDLFKDGEIYENADGNRYRVNHMVWHVDSSGNSTPVIVDLSSSVVKSNQKTVSFSFQIQYPKEVLV